LHFQACAQFSLGHTIQEDFIMIKKVDSIDRVARI
jgi:hypothetical protein